MLVCMMIPDCFTGSIIYAYRLITIMLKSLLQSSWLTFDFFKSDWTTLTRIRDSFKSYLEIATK